MRSTSYRAAPAFIVAAAGLLTGDALAEPTLTAPAEQQQDATERVERGGAGLIPYTYQGRLDDGGAPATGIYDIRFYIYGPLDNFIVGETRTVTVNDGLFTETLEISEAFLDDGPLQLEIQVRPTGTGTYTVLNPRQALTATPFAGRAETAVTALDADFADLANDVVFPLSGTGPFAQPVILADNTGSSSSAIVGQKTGPVTVGALASSRAAVVGETADTSIPAIYGRKFQDPGSLDDDPAVLGENFVDDFYGIGVQGRGGWRGVYGLVQPTGNQGYFGVSGQVSADAPSADARYYAVFGSATGDDGMGTTYGLFGTAAGGETNYAGYFQNGDVIVENDLKREYTSTVVSNALPVAYGSIAADGSILSGTGNFVVTASSTGTYDIRMIGLVYNFSTHTATVTPIVTSSSTTGFRTATASASAGALRVRLWNTSFALDNGPFHFTVFGPSEADARPAARGLDVPEGALGTPIEPERLVRPRPIKKETSLR